MARELIVLCGLPGSGKSTWAKEQKGYTVHSSDAIRKRLYGSEEDQTNPKKVFAILNKELVDDLKKGKNCIYDATSISKWARKNILDTVKDIPCRKVCVWLKVSIDTAKERNASRERYVPEEVIEKMASRFEIPSIEEGFDEVYIL